MRECLLVFIQCPPPNPPTPYLTLSEKQKAREPGKCQSLKYRTELETQEWARGKTGILPALLLNKLGGGAASHINEARK